MPATAPAFAHAPHAKKPRHDCDLASRSASSCVTYARRVHRYISRMNRLAPFADAKITQILLLLIARKRHTHL